ncbi:hypothetical protein Tco_0685059 [Tanacetum coccineum]
MMSRLSLKNDMPLRDKWCITRSSTKELLSPFENSKQKFRSRKRLFDTPSLLELNSPEFDHNFDIEEQLEEEVIETMTKTMEQYMSKTRGDYESGVTRPSINQDTHFELKGKFLKELRDNTFSGSEHEDANEHIKKVLEIVDLFHILKITQDQIMLRAFPEPDESLFCAWERFKELLMKCPQHYLTDMQEVILFYIGLDVPTRQILDSKDVIPSKTAVDAKIAIQEMAEYSQKWHNGTSSRTKSTETSDMLAAIQAQLNNLGQEKKKVNEKVSVHPINLEDNIEQRGQDSTNETMETMAESAKRHEENSNIIKEIRASINAVIRNQGALIKTLEIQIGQMRKVLQERGFGSLPSSMETNPRDQVKSISTAKLIFFRYAVSDVVHTPYQGHNTGVYYLKQSLSQDNYKTLAVMIGESHKM